MRWSFDDMHIGIETEDGRSLQTREIQKPQALNRAAWYAHASEVCKVLNRASSGG